jgi:hypothetical protein
MSGRKTSESPTRIWKFAAKLESPEVALDILRKANRYYNKLVEIERARCARYVATRRTHAPALAGLEDQWTALDEQIVDLYRQAKRERQEHWRDTDGEKRRILPAEFEARKAALVERQKEVSDSAKELRQAFADLLAPARAAFKTRTEELAVKNGKKVGPRAKSLINARVLGAMLAEEEWHPAWKEIARSDDVAHTAAIEARARCDLYGGTYLGVEEAFQRAKKDSSPRPPRFHSFSGGGKIQVQLDKGTQWAAVSGPRCRIESLERRPGAGKRSNMIRLTLNQTRDKGSASATVSAVCKLHRFPPSDAAVKWLGLVVRRIGRRTTCQLQLTLEHPSFMEPKRPAGVRPPTHIRIGWSKVDGGIRVGTGTEHDVLCPAKLLSQSGFASHLESVRDILAFGAVRRMRKTMALAGHEVDGRTWQRLESDRGRADLRRWAEAWALFVLGNVQERWTAWRIVRKQSGLDLYASPNELRAGTGSAREAFAWWCYLWARKDAHLEQYAVDSRRRFVNRRDAHYRMEAIRIATEYESVTVDDYKIDALKKLEPLTMPGSGVRDMAQSQLQDAAPGRFREILIDVMGPRCTPCARPGDQQKSSGARGKKGRSASPAVAVEVTT